MTSDDSRLEEIQKIDYFLANLELAVEQGEMGRQTFDRLSAPYLERRAELEAVATVEVEPEAAAPEAPATVEVEVQAPVAPTVVEPEPEAPGPVIPAIPVAGREAPVPITPVAADSPAPVAAAPAAASAVPATTTPPSAASGQGGEVDRLFDRGAPPGAAPWASKRSSFSLGRWIAYAGAALAVAAALVFAMRGWVRFPPIVRLAGLIGATIVLYADGEWLRKKLSLPVAGSWLMSVGAALFLLDGYALLQLLNLSGPLPWAIVLLVCSIAYWVIEPRVGSGWFGAAGAVLQVGFWWLLAFAMGLGTLWATALLGVVAALWAIGSAGIDPEGPYRALSRVLASGAIALSALVAVAMTIQIPTAPARGTTIWPIAAAAVAAIAATVVFDRARPSLRGRAVGAQVPLFYAIVILWAAHVHIPELAPGPVIVGILFIVTAADAGYALWRNSISFAVVAYIGWLMMWTGVAYELGLSYALMIMATAGLGVVSLAGAIYIAKMFGMERPPRRSITAEVWQVAGALTALTATVSTAVLGGMPGFVGGVPLPPAPTYLPVPPYVLVAAWVMAAVVAIWALMPRAWTAGVVVFGSFVLTAHALAFVAPGWQVSLYAIGLVVLAAAWSQSRGHLKLVDSIPHNGVVIFCRVMYVSLPLAALVLLWPTGAMRSFEFAALLAVVALAWLADALRTHEQLLFIPIPIFAIAAVTVAVWSISTIEMAAICGSAAALGIATFSLFGERERKSWRIATLAASAGTATLLAPLLIGSPGFLAIDLLLGAIVWALLGWAVLIPEIVAVSLGLGVLAVAAFLWWLNPASWVTIVVLSAISAVLLGPRVLLKDSPSPEVARFTASVAAAGLFALTTLDLIGLASYTNLAIASGNWSAMGAAGLAIALFITGVYVIVWTVAERAEIGLYIGLWIVVLGALIGMDAAHINQAEAYLLPVVLYFGVIGVLWSSRKEGRPVPLGADLAVVMLAPVASLIISVGSTDPAAILQHGFWALGLSLATIVAGIIMRARILVFGGLGVLVVDVLWLARNLLVGVPYWAWIGVAVFMLLLAGILYASREPIGKALRGPENRFASWR